MPTRAYKLAMRGPLHVGQIGVGFEETLDYLPSDTLFAVLVITWLEMGLAEVVDSLGTLFAPAAEPPLLLSSAFPYAGEVRLLPRPNLAIQSRLEERNGQASDSARKYKKVRWIGEEVFQRLTSRATPENLNATWAQAKLVQGGAVWLSKDERQLAARNLGTVHRQDLTIWAQAMVPHVVVDRLSNASNLYHVGQVHYAPGCGLWFMARGDDAWLGRLEDALLLMQDGGIGGRRYRGNGHFHLTGPYDPPTLGAGGNYQVLLSRLAPAVNQMDLLKAPASRYDLVTIGGYSSYPGQTPVIRKRVRMLAEGAVIRASPVSPGQLVNVQPEDEEGWKPVPHPIYRYGFGFGVPIHLEEPGEDSNT